jgi:hypothetical protein
MLSVETALLQATQVAARALLSLAFSLGIAANQSGRSIVQPPCTIS